VSPGFMVSLKTQYYILFVLEFCAGWEHYFPCHFSGGNFVPRNSQS